MGANTPPVRPMMLHIPKMNPLTSPSNYSFVNMNSTENKHELENIRMNMLVYFTIGSSNYLNRMAPTIMVPNNDMHDFLFPN